MEWSVGTCNDMHESQNNYVEWKMPDKIESVLYASAILNFRKGKLIYTDRKMTSSCPWGMGMDGRVQWSMRKLPGIWLCLMF